MHALMAYMPADRSYALAHGATLAEWPQGSALFADISGFTALTEELARALGPRRGAEELTQLLNRVYDALIAEVDRYRGSVITFSGDAITCWFEDLAAHQPVAVAAPRATACALALQRVMHQFAAVALPDGSTVALTLKVAVTSGRARRFAVGDPALHLVDVLAGATVARLANAEHLAAKGDVVVDAPTLAALGAPVPPARAWRADPESGEFFAVVNDLQLDVPPTPWPTSGIVLDAAQVRPWMLPAVFSRLEQGLGEFLTELRPAATLFLRFGGIDYDADADAGQKLDTFVRRVQAILERYAGALLQLTIGDKGSYLYAAFGAPVAHEDDTRRVVMAALELRALADEIAFLGQVQIGISRGMMRTGAYGGLTRRTYGSLSDEVNMAARLMQHAAPGEVLVSGRVYHDVAALFVWEVLPPITVKGKSEPIPIARLLGAQTQRSAHRDFQGGMIGRAQELRALATFLEPLAEGRFAGMLYVYGEPGMGKSRLLYALRQQLNAAPRTVVPLWLVCPADELLRQSLSPFRHMLRVYANQDAAGSSEQNRARFDTALGALIAAMRGANAPDLARELERTRSFLGALIDLHWEASLYEQLDPKLRFENTLAAIKALILAESRMRPVIVQIEDAHWLDDDSRAVLALLTRNVGAFPLAVLLNSRYRDDGSAIAVAVDADVPQQTLHLGALSSADTNGIASQTLGGDVNDALARLLMEKTEGNPFFIEQLALDLRERGVLARAADARWTLIDGTLDEVPPTINVVLVARLDRLAAQVKAVVQTAAVLGQEFEVRVLAAMLRDDSVLPISVRRAEEGAIWQALNEIRYLFRHALLRDAAYSMQLWARLRLLHALAAESLAQVYADELAAHAADLAYHYGKAEDAANELRFAWMAGEQAAATFANADAVAYLSRALALASNDDARATLLLARERVYDRMGARDQQRHDLDALQGLAEASDDATQRVEVALRQSRYADVTSEYPAMIAAAQHAIAVAQAATNVSGKASGYVQWARALWYQGHYAEAQMQAQRALRLAQQAAPAQLIADCLRLIGNVLIDQGHYAEARTTYQQALALHQASNDRQGESYTLNNMGTIGFYQGDHATARTDYERALRMMDETGDRYGQSLALLNLGEVAAVQGDYGAARAYYEQALRLKKETNDRYGQSVVLSNVGDVALLQGDYAAARTYYTQALALCRALGHRQQECWVLTRLALLSHQIGAILATLDYSAEALHIAAAINDRNTLGYALTQQGHALLALARLDEAAGAYQQALDLRRALEQHNLLLEPLAGLAHVALVRNDLVLAAAHVAEMQAHLETGNLDGVDEPALIHLVCYRILARSGDSRAAALLDRAYTTLVARAALLDGGDAQAFLEHVPAHRELVAAWTVLRQR